MAQRSAPMQPGPTLVVAKAPSSRPAALSVLALWHLLSLDAPTVAALWTYFLARCVSVHLPWPTIVAMFVAVWMIYAADRLLDAKALDGGNSDTALNNLEERHRFHHRHRHRFVTALVGAAILLVVLLPQLSPEALLRYCLLATLLGAWMLVIHASNAGGAESERLPKELVVGIFFPAAVFIPTVVRAPSLQLMLLPEAALFAGVCTLNCLFVYAWEHPTQSVAQARAHWTTLYGIRHLQALALGVLLLSLLAAKMSPTLRLPCLACAVSCTLLLVLHRVGRNISEVHLRATADVVLLTPALLLPWLAR